MCWHAATRGQPLSQKASAGCTKYRQFGQRGNVSNMANNAQGVVVCLNIRSTSRIGWRTAEVCALAVRATIKF